MKKLLTLFTLFSLASCVSLYYQRSELKSTSSNIKNGNCYEDSVFKITYNFWSVGGVLKFDLYNKLNVPVYIDWLRSNFILNGKSVTYDIAYMNEAVPGSVPILLKQASGKEYYVSLGRDNKMAEQLPPHSYITVAKFHLNMPYYNIGYYPKTQDSTIYSYDNSILHFRNYIGYTTNQDMSDLKFIDNEFWLEKVFTINSRYFNENAVIPYAFYASYER
jgi:hypothetical protein